MHVVSRIGPQAFAASLLACGILGCAPPGADIDSSRDNVDEIEIENSDTSSLAKIVNGTRDPQTVVLTAGQRLAIGYLARSNGAPFCTATLVSTRMVISANHCVRGRTPNQVFFGIGPNPSAPTAILPVIEIDQNPSTDFSLLILGFDAGKFAPVEPLPMNRKALERSWIGKWVDAAGYGQTHTTERGLFFAAVQIVGFDNALVSIDGHGERGICFGDSGGPILLQDPELGPVIVGTEQYGDPSCVDVDYLTRVDKVAAWVEERAAQGLPPVLQPCGDVGSDTICNGNYLQRCSAGWLQSTDCSDGGGRCGLAGAQEMGCLPAACGQALDFTGECDGNTARWCTTTGLVERDCTQLGLSCIHDDASGTSRCQCVQCGSDCVDITFSTQHCGGCNVLCSPANATGACDLGLCRIGSCNSGFADEDGDVSNGCEKLVVVPSNNSGGGCAATPRASVALAAMSLVALLALSRRRRWRRESEG